MSVSHTEAAVRSRTKTVTRRLGWQFLRPGDRLTLCRKVMGRRAGEPLIRIAEVEVIGVRRESLLAMADDDVAREGIGPRDPRFDEWYEPDGMPPASSFVSWWLDTFAPAGFNPHVDDVTRIEWRYLS